MADFIWAYSSCGDREDSENYKMKGFFLITKSGIRTLNFSIRLATDYILAFGVNINKHL